MRNVKSQIIYFSFAFLCNDSLAHWEITTKSKNYFMSVDLKYQLKMMFDSVKIKKEIFDFINKMDNSNNDEIPIRDIYDSELYKKINSDTNMKYITYNLSTDGAPLTKSGKRGFWPLQIILNCLHPKSRFKYSLICGMLTCTEEPNSDLANLYFNNFKEQAALLYNEGITVTDLNEQKIIIKFCSLAIPIDSVCRPIVQNRIKFNGYFGCSSCYHPGEHIKDVSGIRYGLLDIDPEIRTHASHLKYIKIINSKNLNLDKIISERGVKGDITSITKLPHIDMVLSFSYDYMHGLLAGVKQQIFKKWTDSKSTSNFKLTNQEIKVINQRLLSIQPTQDIHRQPRSLKEKGNWKSAEIKSWCLIYSLPCLQGILDDTALKQLFFVSKKFIRIAKK